MAIETESHAKRFGVFHGVHLIDATMAFHTADSTSDVDCVIKVSVIGHLMNLHPRHRFPSFITLTHDGQQWAVHLDLVVTVHAGLRGRDRRSRPLIHSYVAIAAIQTELPRVNRMAKRHWLHRCIPYSGVTWRHVIRDCRGSDTTEDK